MTIDEAKSMIDAGMKFGVVFPMISELDHAALRAHFVFGSASPDSGGKTDPPVVEPGTMVARMTGKRVRVGSMTGEECFNCRGMNVARTGTCLTCLDCGSSLGGCG